MTETINKDKLFFFSEDYSNLRVTPNSLEHAYFALLDDDLSSAKEIFNRLDSPRANWGSILVEVIEGYLIRKPTYFLIRNFLEIDLDFLLKNKKINYVEQLLGALDLAASINQESYKFAARVMYENKLYTAALKYMEESKKIYYNDPELHFMLSKYFLDFKQYKKANFYIDECLKMLPSYYPAKIMKEKIEELDF